MIPDWQLPPGVDRGLWDYLRSREMAANYDSQIAASPLAEADVRFCEKHFSKPGRLLDLGCGTGRLCAHFAAKGFECVGVDLSDEMLAKARTVSNVTWLKANIVELHDLPEASFDNVACLFSTLGMIRTPEHRQAVVANAFRLLKPGGTFVVHVHNRWFRGLGWRRFLGGDMRMPQAYGGAALTIHHFSRREINRLLRDAGLLLHEVCPVGATETKPAASWLPACRVYGYLVSAQRPSVSQS
jgi:SAM-dependent methyltransferase